jgi:hypothetical protein
MSSIAQARELRILSPTGVLGSGFLESSFKAALSRKPHVIGCDAGTTDGGPFALGAGKPSFPRLAVKRDLRLMLLGARSIKVPLLIGSCGTAGAEIHLQIVHDILQQIAREEGLSFRLALIHAEQDKEYLKTKLREGRIKPLYPAPTFDEAVIDRSERIVGMMGTEPYVRALEMGADVILAGRSSDTAMFCALPHREGFAKGIALHAAKILECGTAAVVQRKTPDCMLATLRDDHFEIGPLDTELRCTPQSIASHSLYENADPFLLKEPAGTLDTTQARYEALSERLVRVSGSDFISADTYTIKLEGAEIAGYQTILIGGVRDPYILRQLDDWLAGIRARIESRVSDVTGLSTDDYVFNIRVYGKNGTMGKLEPVQTFEGHEACLIFEVTAQTQELATTIAAITRHQAIHFPIPEWSGLITGVACPYSPAYIERGAVYRFNVNHVVEPDDPCEMFPIEIIDL